MIIGGSGSGKSTVARKLGDITGLPVVHIDKIHWQPGWVERPEAERFEIIHETVAADQWILDGNYSSTFALRAARADTIIFLDISTPRRITRVVWRTISNLGGSRSDMPAGCPESLNARFVDFVVNWVAGYQARGARTKAILFIDNPQLDSSIRHLKSPRDVRRFLAEVAGQKQQKTAPEEAVNHSATR